MSRPGAGNSPMNWNNLINEDPSSAKQQILFAYIANGGNAIHTAKFLDISHRSLMRYVKKLSLGADIKKIRDAVL